MQLLFVCVVNFAVYTTINISLIIVIRTGRFSAPVVALRRSQQIDLLKLVRITLFIYYLLQ